MRGRTCPGPPAYKSRLLLTDSIDRFRPFAKRRQVLRPDKEQRQSICTYDFFLAPAGCRQPSWESRTKRPPCVRLMRTLSPSFLVHGHSRFRIDWTRSMLRVSQSASSRTYSSTCIIYVLSVVPEMSVGERGNVVDHCFTGRDQVKMGDTRFSMAHGLWTYEGVHRAGCLCSWHAPVSSENRTTWVER